ncbi:MAG: MATE family efflux transporter [Oscillospiraceae bacterium]|nr:MATE family efflux transporter [Oscillospiraceae bacterium]
MQTNDLTQGSILKSLLRFFFPILFGMLFQQLYNTVDAVVVGRVVGPEALAAVGGSPAVIINLVIGVFTGMAAGATVIISQYFGSRDDERLSRAVHTILVFCLLAGAALTLLGRLSALWSLRMVKTPADILDLSCSYLRIYYLGAVPLLLFNVASGVLRAVGDSRRPLYYLGVCCGMNIALDLLFVAALRWGVDGVAWATVLSQLTGAVLILLRLGRSEGPERMELRKLRIDAPSLKRILYIGIPAAIQGAMYSISNILIQAAINDFGTVVVAAWTAISKFDGVYWVTSNSFGAAICTFVGQNFGAGKYERMKEGVRKWLLTAIGTAIAMSALLIGLSRWGLRLFTTDAAVVAEATRLMWYFIPFYAIWSFIEIISNTLRGAGDAIAPTVISLIGVCLLRIVWIAFVVPYWHTVMGISMSYPVTWFITAVTFVIYYYKSNWLTRCAGHVRQGGNA